MSRQYKVVQCPHCFEYTYLPTGVHRKKCPRCNTRVALHELQGAVVPTVKEAQHLVQSQQYALHGLRALNCTTSPQNPSTQILFILRKQRTDRPEWHSIKEIIDQCTSIGFQFEEVKSAIITLVNEGFLEVQEELVRVIPLN